ncbi:ribosome biogenesis GTPase [Candidatus Kryptonium thompsonii]|uniref:Small ribosomal subunit biogenesis GTPase RsgA n=1 Tax=Candidatus Kryptonium thompsonii TaxID=1633631 RepID=A0A0P1P7Z8_9BACT|nr:ribosome small subunit-dependent GTPase A [Candidatus Kryptonium thompsoni]CUS76987.1 ribosome biogenesis GTPase [Candidatus Kryptonium thompsoni]CUS79824.1 ribosome biogenesis GTPase [Candidatus Kryptonium thompsoni]CUS93961.1 ribosome biogenesis GTPase [Candidatus Kryptonium thompsoni]CUT00861.1 ribosome biogenesis GTPase [Candidatus Kryptonium thompsoni]CUT01396.1 ribosome biogenesis GTPase [Candidatus Kryptonium thompsoni]
MGDVLVGKVISAHGAIFNVQVGDEVIQCKLRGKMRLQDKVSTSPVVAGDNVKVRILEDGTGVIEEVFERFNKLYRKAVGKRELEHVIVANIDQAIVVTSFNMPYVPWGFVDRLLIASERNNIKPIICINKIDLIEDWKEVNEFVKVYGKKAGYEIIKTSAETGEGLDNLKKILKDKTSVFVGQSGVGKSALINAIEPGLDVVTMEVSEKTGKGRHTTTHTELHHLSFGGFIADTPGVKEFGLAGISKSELGFYYPEFRKFLDQCKFSNCTHVHEPDCAVKEALNAGKIDRRRYMNYVNILNSLEEN